MHGSGNPRQSRVGNPHIANFYHHPVLYNKRLHRRHFVPNEVLFVSSRFYFEFGILPSIHSCFCFSAPPKNKKFEFLKSTSPKAITINSPSKYFLSLSFGSVVVRKYPTTRIVSPILFVSFLNIKTVHKCLLSPILRL